MKRFICLLICVLMTLLPVSGISEMTMVSLDLNSNIAESLLPGNGEMIADMLRNITVCFGVDESGWTVEIDSGDVSIFDLTGVQADERYYISSSLFGHRTITADHEEFIVIVSRLIADATGMEYDLIHSLLNSMYATFFTTSLEEIPDTEIPETEDMVSGLKLPKIPPVILRDLLGIMNNIRTEGDIVTITITPQYLNRIVEDLNTELKKNDVTVIGAAIIASLLTETEDDVYAVMDDVTRTVTELITPLESGITIRYSDHSFEITIPYGGTTVRAYGNRNDFTETDHTWEAALELNDACLFSLKVGSHTESGRISIVGSASLHENPISEFSGVYGTDHFSTDIKIMPGELAMGGSAHIDYGPDHFGMGVSTLIGTLETPIAALDIDRNGDTLTIEPFYMESLGIVRITTRAGESPRDRVDIENAVAPGTMTNAEWKYFVDRTKADIAVALLTAAAPFAENTFHTETD